MKLYEHEYYKRAMYASRSKQSANIIGGGYLAPKHKAAFAKKYGSSNQLVKFRVVEDEIMYKPFTNKGVFGCIMKIESPEDLRGIACYQPVYAQSEEEEVYHFAAVDITASEPETIDEDDIGEEELNEAI
jgi:hypothetical protein